MHQPSGSPLRWTFARRSSLPLVPEQLATLRTQGVMVKSLFLDATTGTLVRRYSETRRKHPLSQSGADHLPQDQRRALMDAIELERSCWLICGKTPMSLTPASSGPRNCRAYVQVIDLRIG